VRLRNDCSSSPHPPSWPRHEKNKETVSIFFAFVLLFVVSLVRSMLEMLLARCLDLALVP